MIIKNLKIQMLAVNSLKICVGVGFEISSTLINLLMILANSVFFSNSYFHFQKFGDSNRFGPGSSNGRLTILNNGGGGNFQQPQYQRPNSIPVDPPAIQSFAAVPAVPPLEDDEDPIVPNFGNQSKSIRPPSRNPLPVHVQTLLERIQALLDFGSNFSDRPPVLDTNSFESLPSRSNVR